MKIYTKLLSKFDSRSLKTTDLLDNRDSDAFIAHLLGWSDLEQDAVSKIWTGDSPDEAKIFSCYGRCTVPYFTTTESSILLSLLESSLSAHGGNLSMNIFLRDSVWTILSGFNGEEEASVSVSASSLGLALSRVFVAIRLETLHKKPSIPKKPRKPRTCKPK